MSKNAVDPMTLPVGTVLKGTSMRTGSSIIVIRHETPVDGFTYHEYLPNAKKTLITMFNSKNIAVHTTVKN